MGYTQSNFNSDNCLIGGVTVDFGPFGFIERCARTSISKGASKVVALAVSVEQFDP